MTSLPPPLTMSTRSNPSVRTSKNSMSDGQELVKENESERIDKLFEREKYRQREDVK